MTNHQIRVARGIAAACAVIFVPKVAFTATMFFNNGVQPTPLGWTAIALAVLLLTNTCTFLKGPVLGNSLAMMLLVYSATSFVSGLGLQSPLGPAASMFWAGLAFAVMLLVRFLLKPPTVSLWKLLTRLELVRYSALVFLASWLHVSNGGGFQLWGGVLVIAVMLWPVVCVLISSGFFTTTDWGAKTLTGTARWIMPFCIGGNVIGWVVEVGSHILPLFLVLAVASYVLFYIRERPILKTLVLEALAVAGSGVATTLHLFFLNRDLFTTLDASHHIAFWGYVALCFAAVGFLVDFWERKFPPQLSSRA